MAKVILVGGVSGTGKTQASTRLARHLGANVTSIDDLHLAILTMTTPAQLPAVHAWFVHPDPTSLSAADIVEMHLAASRAVLPAFEAVVLDHLQDGPPCVLEGSYLLPELLTRPALTSAVAQGEVQGVFLREPEEAQLVRNLLVREPAAGDQSGRAHVSSQLSERLHQEAERCGVPTLEARPWETVLERLLELVADPRKVSEPKGS